jgi:hypothetical protein
MRKLRLLALSSLSVLFIASSCTKEGPEGPAGAAGAQGPAGSPGAAGTPGAGVTTYSPWFLTGSGWKAGTSADPFYGEEFYFLRAATVVTQAIIDQGIVLCYMKGDPNLDAPANATAFMLPYTVGPGFGFTDLYDFTLSPGNIRFLYKTDLAWALSDLAVISFRYVVIPGTISGRNSTPTYGGYTREELKAMSYEEVSAKFNIPAEGTNIR